MVANDNPDVNGIVQPSAMSAIKRVSWPAVFAGVVVVLVVQLVLSLLGIGIGASTIDPLTEQNPTSGIGIGSGIWLALSTLIALFLGGWVSGRLSGTVRKGDGSLHGILSWGLATIVTFYFLTSAVGGIVSSTANIIGRGVTAIGQGLTSLAPKVADTVGDQLTARAIDLSDIKNEAAQILRQTGKPELQPDKLEAEAQQAAADIKASTTGALQNPSVASRELETVIDRIFSQGKATLEVADREALINVLVARTNMSPAEASATVDRWQSIAQAAQARFTEAKAQAEQTAREAADKTARAVSKASLWSSIALMLGAIASALGGYLGSVSNFKFSFAPPESTINSHRTALHS